MRSRDLQKKKLENQKKSSFKPSGEVLGRGKHTSHPIRNGEK